MTAKAAGRAVARLDWRGRALEIEHEWVGAPRGAAPVVVFLHEGLGSVAMWKEFPRDLCEAHGLSGFVFSRYGYGGSTPKPRDEHWPPDFMHRQADEVLSALFAQLGIERPWLFGHSDGASIALLHASRHLVAGVVAMAPHLFVEVVSIASIENARHAYEHGDLRARLARHHDDVDSAFYGWNDAWLSPDFRPWNIEAEVARVAAPVLALQGDADEYGTLEQVKAVVRALPDTARLVVVEGAGHSPHRDRPEVVIDAAGRFFADVAACERSPARSRR